MNHSKKMRDNCDSLRDLAMIDMLSSTGMRVGEMVRLNRDDIRFDERECVVFGKGRQRKKLFTLTQEQDSSAKLFARVEQTVNRHFCFLTVST